MSFSGFHTSSISINFRTKGIQEIVLTANLTSRKCLGFKTPLQAIFAELAKDVKIRFA